MSIPSKKGKILVSGFISSAWNEIVFGLINEAKATLTTLLPRLVLTAFGTNDVLTPDLLNPTLCSVLIMVDVVTLLPRLDTSVLLLVSLTVPAHISFQLFHTVPRFKSITPWDARSVKVSKVPGIVTCRSGNVSVSIHSSISGVKVTLPI